MAEPDHHVDGVLEWLDGPRLVVGAFAFFVLGLTVLGIFLWTDQRKQAFALEKQVARIDEIVTQRVEEEKSAKRDQVATCFSRAAQGPSIRAALLALEREANSPEAHQTLRNFRELSELNTPTIRECRQLAKRLNVHVQKGVR